MSNNIVAIYTMTGVLMRRTILGAVMALGIGATANAADIYEGGGSFKDDVSYMPAITWAGFYAGGHIGSTFAGDLREDDGGSVQVFDVDDGLTGGAHVGYNWQHERWVYGIEADISAIDDEVQGIELVDYVATLRGRLGVSFDSTLLYATAGVALLNWADDYQDLFLGELDDTTTGYVIGAGIDHKLNNRFSIGVEGLYYDFSQEVDAFDFETERDFWVVRARASYHFNSGYAEPLK